MALGADTPEHKATLLRMADTWRELAAARELELARQARLANLEEIKEDDATDR